MATEVTMILTPVQAKILFNTVDGASDAGSCKGGCTPQELKALEAVMGKLLLQKWKWLHTEIDKG